MARFSVKRKAIILFLETGKHLFPRHSQNICRIIYIGQENRSHFLFRIAQQGAVFRIKRNIPKIVERGKNACVAELGDARHEEKPQASFVLFEKCIKRLQTITYGLKLLPVL